MNIAPADSVSSPEMPVPGRSGIVACLEDVGVLYGKQWALRDVSATFPRGAVGLLGPNGAGKSTLIKTLLGLIAPDRGRLHVLGFDVAQKAIDIRGRIATKRGPPTLST